MSSFLKVFILAVIQGITEFLPVSSSGHLVLAKHHLGLASSGVTLEVALHAGTLLSILVFYRKRIIDLIKGVFSGDRAARFYCTAVVLATLPAIGGYVLFDDYIEAMFHSHIAAAGMLCITGVILLSLLFARRCAEELTLGKSVLVGMAQAFAMIPGVSRAGSTIALSRHMGISPERSAEFSFLMAVPVLAGAALIESLKFKDAAHGDLTPVLLLFGALVSAAVGFISLILLVKVLKSGKFWLFGIYCLAIGATALIIG